MNAEREEEQHKLEYRNNEVARLQRKLPEPESSE
jgi:hypothetical protein